MAFNQFNMKNNEKSEHNSICDSGISKFLVDSSNSHDIMVGSLIFQ
jgi:hypothetical protein